MDFCGFFSSVNVIVYELFFRVLSTSQVAYIRLKKVRFIAQFFASWNKERRTIGAWNRCRRAKIISLCDIIALFLFILRVRFGSRVWLRLRKSLKVGQTTTLCPAQDYIFHIFRNFLCLFVAGFALDCNQGLCFHFPRFTIRNCQDWMFEKLRNLNANADKVELRYKAVGRKNVARESIFKRKHYALI